MVAQSQGSANAGTSVAISSFWKQRHDRHARSRSAIQWNGGIALVLEIIGVLKQFASDQSATSCIARLRRGLAHIISRLCYRDF